MGAALAAMSAVMVMLQEASFMINAAGTFHRLSAGSTRIFRLLSQVFLRMSAHSTLAPKRKRAVKNSMATFTVSSPMLGCSWSFVVPSTTLGHICTKTSFRKPTELSQYPFLFKQFANVSSIGIVLVSSWHNTRYECTSSCVAFTVDQCSRGASDGSGAWGPKVFNIDRKRSLRMGTTTLLSNDAMFGGPGSPAAANENTKRPISPMLKFSSDRAHHLLKTDTWCKRNTATLVSLVSSGRLSGSTRFFVRSTLVSHSTASPASRKCTHVCVMTCFPAYCISSTVAWKHFSFSTEQYKLLTSHVRCRFFTPCACGSVQEMVPVDMGSLIPCARRGPGWAQQRPTLSCAKHKIAFCVS